MKSGRVVLLCVLLVAMSTGCATCQRCATNTTRITDRQNQNNPFEFQNLDLANEQELADLRQDLDDANRDKDDLRRLLEEAIADRNNNAFNALGINDALGLGNIDPNNVDSTKPQLAQNEPNRGNKPGPVDEARARRLTPAPLSGNDSRLPSSTRTHGT